MDLLLSWTCLRISKSLRVAVALTTEEPTIDSGHLAWIVVQSPTGVSGPQPFNEHWCGPYDSLYTTRAAIASTGGRIVARRRMPKAN